MDKPSKPQRDLAIVAAIDRVLAAEHEAELAIAAAQRRAEERVERARALRRALLERTQGRVTRLHAGVAAKLEEADEEASQRIAEIGREERSSLRPDCIDQAIATLANRLSGADE